MKRDEHRQLDRGTKPRWMSYASAGSVALASTSASGGIVNMNNLVPDGLPSGIIMPVNSMTSSIKLEIDLDGQPGHEVGLILNRTSNSIFSTATATVSINDRQEASHCISGQNTYAGRIWLASIGCTGLQISDNNLFPVQINGGDNGWVRISLEISVKGKQEEPWVQRPTYTRFFVEEGWYEDTGSAISIGERGTAAIPEPSGFAYLGLLAAGAGGVLALKKFRKQQLIEEAKA